MRGFIPQAVAAIPVALLTALPASAEPFFFSTGNVTNSIATATRPESAGKFEIESADDFVLTAPTAITSATFTGFCPPRPAHRPLPAPRLPPRSSAFHARP